MASGAGVTEDLIKAAAGQFDLESIARVDLSGRGIEAATNLNKCPNLKELDLSGNRLKDPGCIPKVASLTHLDLSRNRLADLAGLSSLTNLTHLDLRGNMVVDPKQLKHLKNIPNLKTLFLKGPEDAEANPVCSHPTYFTSMTSNPSLTSLDGEVLLLAETAQKALLDAGIKDEGEYELPPSLPWTVDTDMDVDALFRTSGIADPATMKKFQGLQGAISSCHELDSSTKKEIAAVMAKSRGK